METWEFDERTVRLEHLLKQILEVLIRVEKDLQHHYPATTGGSIQVTS